MVKLLIAGNISENWSLLLDRVNSVNQSHGPFHVLLITGKTNITSRSNFDEIIARYGESFKIPTYFYDFEGPLEDYIENMPENVHTLQEFSFPKKSPSLGMCTLPHFNLTIGFIKSNDIPDCNDDKNDYAREIHEICQAYGYKGCDILLSSEWPKDIHQFTSDEDLQNLQILSSTTGIHMGSRIVGLWANVMRPRYHFTSTCGFYFQRSPYRNIISLKGASKTDSDWAVYSRFISLAHVNEAKNKEKKWLHALSIDPIIVINPRELKEFTEEPPLLTENPYAEVGSTVGVTEKRSDALDHSSDPAAKRLKADTSAADQGSFFFGTMGVPHENHIAKGRANIVLIPPTPDAKTLFVGGLTIDTTDSDILGAFPGSSTVRKASGKPFAFVEFSSHEDASKVVTISTRKGYNIRGRNLSIGWASNAQLNYTGAMADNSLIGSDSSKSLFISGLPHTFHDEDLLAILPGSTQVHRKSGKGYVFVEFSSNDAANMVVQYTKDDPISFQGKQLIINWAKGDSSISSSGAINLVPPSSDARTLFVGGLSPSVTAGDIQNTFKEAISIRRAEGRDFAFVEFSSFSEAKRVVDAQKDKSAEYSIDGKVLLIGWAQGKPADKTSVSSHAGNCWFCLASPTVAVHLVVSVGSTVYLALPKGGVVDFHVLIVPIDCIPSRLHLSSAAKIEFQSYENALKQMFSKLNLATLIYERAIRTKGRDHMQQHMIPIPVSAIANACNIFKKVHEDFRLHFHEIQDDRDIDDVVMNMEGGPYQEYFYVSVPTSIDSKKSRRFVYVHEDKSKQFPMFLGSEISAKIISKPERANWKNCVISEDAEHDLADRFRNSFEAYDFTLTD